MSRESTQGHGHWTHRRPDLLPRGERHRSAKLTDVAVRAMRAAKASGATTTSIAKRFGVSFKSARRAILGETWSHIK